MKPYFVYIMTNRTRTLRVARRVNWRGVCEHRPKLLASFTSRCALDRLVYFEHSKDVRAPLARKRQLKG
jgi:predicted GIY-YIG superfamily endonuclease